jgi:hypothetical protein
MTSDCTRIGRTSWVAGWANLRLLRLAVLPAAAAVLTVLLSGWANCGCCGWPYCPPPPPY